MCHSGKGMSFLRCPIGLLLDEHSKEPQRIPSMSRYPGGGRNFNPPKVGGSREGRGKGGVATPRTARPEKVLGDSEDR